MYEVREGTAWLRLQRPEAKNAIDLATLRSLLESTRTIEEDPDVRDVVLTGAGDTFCAGGDIKEMVARRGKSVATFERQLEGLAALHRAIASSSRIYIARVNGDAIGAGLGLVLLCDLSVAADSARLSAPFGRIGLVADTGVSALVARFAGLRRAKELLFTGRVLAASEALDWGLINRVAPAAQLDAAVTEMIAALRSTPAATVARLKRQLQRNDQVPTSDALIHEAILQGLSFSTPEHAERVDAFLARKREASARGR